MVKKIKREGKKVKRPFYYEIKLKSLSPIKMWVNDKFYEVGKNGLLRFQTHSLSIEKNKTLDADKEYKFAALKKERLRGKREEEGYLI